ncbi:VanZ like family protein [Rhypophila decipiens]|uniref:VanZ like family protein n=1 Tax=Rhypophila decipiens TaxID=261697 RepID=A0AAN6YH04_9PEZI|nr:VanZ like family protein [Rhypophila decipiens]
MRIRLPFAGLFFLLLFIAGYAGLTSFQVNALVNDKVLHLVTFFLLTLVFYWIIDTNRRRTLNLTLVVCTLGLGVGSEVLQALLPNGREFDLFDVVGNVVGSLAGLGLCSWYHKRMLERKRVRKHYNAVPGEDGEEDVGLDEQEDLELGEGPGFMARQSVDGHEEGVVIATNSTTTTSTMGTTTADTTHRAPVTLEEEVDNWDEHADDDAWDEDDGDIGGATSKDTGTKRAG